MDVFLKKITFNLYSLNNQVFMKGQKIKEILKAEGISLTEVAKLLGFEGDQRLHSALRSNDVKTGLVENIARVTNKDVCIFYDSPNTVIANQNSMAVSGNGNNVNANENVTDKFISLLAKKDEQIDRLLSLLEIKK
jgi:transcriptional regulator with XRE-family HTH domain